MPIAEMSDVLSRVRWANHLTLNDRAKAVANLGPQTIPALVDLCVVPGVPVLGRLCALKALGVLAHSDGRTMSMIERHWEGSVPILARVCRQPQSAFSRDWDPERLRAYEGVRVRSHKLRGATAPFTAQPPHRPKRRAPSRRGRPIGTYTSGRCVHGMDRTNCAHCRPDRFPPGPSGWHHGR